ncbi:hypothetical protein Tco_1233321 [Tanacetum coccineum]
MKRVNIFVDMDTELVEGSEVKAEGSETRVEGSSKRAGEELEQESSKKQRLEEDKETTELQRLIEVIPDKEEVAIDVIPLATKPPSILVKAKYGSTRPVEDLDLVLYGDLKTMFDPHVEDQLMLLVYKLLLSVFRVNAAITKLQLLKRLRLLEDFLLSENG